MEAIRLYGFGKLMEYCIETAVDARNSAEYTQQVTNIQTGLSEHRFIGSTIVGNEIAANIRRRPDQTSKLCRLMSDVGVTPAPQVAQQIGCAGEIANPDDFAQAYIPAPKNLVGFPGAQPAKQKTRRKRWTLANGDIGEWDSQHGEVEVYDSQGKTHKGAFNPDTGQQTKPPEPGRTTPK